MKLKKLITRFSLILAVSIGFAAPASAELVRETGLSTGMATNSLKLPVDPNPQNYWSGLQLISIDNAASILAYCIDPFQWSPSANTTYQKRTDFSAFFGSRAADISKLFSLYYVSTLPGAANANVNAAGFQLALWELVADDKVLTTGVVLANASTNSSVTSAAQAMLAGLAAPASGLPSYTFTIYTSATNQDYIVAKVPEPTSILLLGVALVAAAGVARRRKA